MSKIHIVSTFFELHHEEHTHTKHPDTCPICNILMKETLQIFEDNVSEKVMGVVTRHMKIWEGKGARIAQHTTPSILTSRIMDVIMSQNLSPKPIDLALEHHEIMHHPFVIQKIKELTK